MKTQKGFTVTELLVSSALLSMISIMLFSVLNSVTNATATGQDRAKIYRETRMVFEQLTRELKQTLPYKGNSTNFVPFLVTSTDLHFIACIDNSFGREEAEVHYFYDGTNTLWKSVIFANDDLFDLDTTDLWYETPYHTQLYLDKTRIYSEMLDGVKSFTVKTTDSEGNQDTIWPHGTALTNSFEIPQLVEVEISIFDEKAIKFWKSAHLVQNQIPRKFNILVKPALSK